MKYPSTAMNNGDDTGGADVDEVSMTVINGEGSGDAASWWW